MNRRNDQTAATSGAEFRPAYNLFRRVGYPDLFCAVPEHYPVPRFIDGRCWSYAGKVASPADAPAGFESEVASGVVPSTGFYLFTPHPAEAPSAGVRASGPEASDGSFGLEPPLAPHGFSLTGA